MDKRQSLLVRLDIHQHLRETQAAMSDIPTRPAWVVLGRNTEDHIADFKHCESASDAQIKLETCRAERPDLKFEIRESQVPIPDRTLPTPEQIKGICRILHRALVLIRNAGYAEETLLMREIAEAFHNVPQEMFDENNWDWNALSLQLRDLEQRFPYVLTYNLSSELEEVRTIGG